MRYKVTIVKYQSMPLIPRWEVMTDDAKLMTKRIAFSALVLLLSLWVIRAIIPWVIFALLGYWAFKWFSKGL